MRFLFVSKGFPPIPDASGRIVFNIASELIKYGNEVDVITNGSTWENVRQGDINVISVKNSYWDRLFETYKSGKCNWIKRIWYRIFTLLRKVVLAFNICNFPDVETRITKRIINIYKQRVSDGVTYDSVIGFFRPYSCLNAVIQIKKMCPSVHVISYIFDIVEDKDCPSFMPLRLYRKLIQRGDVRICETCDDVILPKSVEGQEYSVFGKFREKVEYLEFPSFVERKSEFLTESSEYSELSFVFAGTLDTSFRNPRKMISAFTILAAGNPAKTFRLHIFGGGNCAEIITSYKGPENLIINYHGLAPKEVVTEAERNADFLINITNDYKSTVPSKIFELFAMRKPIINFISNGDDGSGVYFDRYPLHYSVFADESKCIEEDIKSLENFINDVCGCYVDQEIVSKAFYECTPEYVAHMLISIVEKGSDAGR